MRQSKYVDSWIEVRLCDLAAPESIRRCAAGINGEVGPLALIWVMRALDAPELAGVGGRYLLDRSIGEPSAEAQDDNSAVRFWRWATDLVGEPG